MKFSATIPFLAALLATAALAAPRYEARIRRTSFGIPHIEAGNLAGLGFGEGYAQAEDHLCSIADQAIRVRGERARYFGAGKNNEHLSSDVTMKALEMVPEAERGLARQTAEMRHWYEGFVAGYNQYLAETGKDKIAGWCRGADWVGPITPGDVAGYHRMLALTIHHYAAAIATAAPPAGGRTETAAVAWPEIDLGASNGWAIGRDKSESGRGMLVANPHYPWVGSNRFWEKHLRIPGRVDVYGVGLIGAIGVQIGFNRAVAWTHTVSAGKRVTFYTLDLAPGKPTVYRYGNQERLMKSRAITVAVRQSDGSIQPVKRRIWFSHYGPILNYPGTGWSSSRVLTIRDANWDNEGRTRQYVPMNRARSLREFQEAHARYQALPWVNTIAASAAGVAWYADTASTPNLSPEAVAQWRRRRESDDLTRRMWRQGSVLLDGSDPLFEWVADPAARAPGVVAYRNMPQLERTDYVFNANDSFWLANSNRLLEGPYSPLHGEQGTARSLRTRNNDLTLRNRSPDRPAGENGKFTLDEMADAILSNRSLAAELIKDELAARCRRQPSAIGGGIRVDLREACEALERWNGRNDLDSRGAVLFREFLGGYEPPDLLRKGRLWAVDFDPGDPAGTPHTLAPGDAALENLARAVSVLRSRGLAPDVPLGEVQYAEKAGRRFPIHGGDGAYDGLMNMQRNGRNTTTLEPMDNPPPVQGSRFLTEQGYPVVHGSSFLMALEFTGRGPRAKAFLTYSQSGDPASPHFTDQTGRFSGKHWRAVLFEESEIAKDVQREYRVRSR